MEQINEHNKVIAGEPEAAPELEALLQDVFRQISPDDTALSNCKARLGDAALVIEPISYRFIYPAAVAAGLVGIGIVFIITSLLIPAQAAEPQFVPEQTLTLADGTTLLIAKGSAFQVKETERELILEKGWVRLNCPANKDNAGAFKVITPPDTVINSGSNFIPDYNITKENNNLSRVFLVSGNIELLTLK